MKTISPLRMRILARLVVGSQIGRIDVRGLDSILNAAEQGPLVFACSHMTDMDMPIVAYVLANHLRLAVANQSLHYSFSIDPLTNILLRIAGPSNFFSITYTAKPRDGVFVTNDFVPMAKSIYGGASLLIAAHAPMYEPKLPERGGIGAVYVAGLTGVPIVPVAIRLNSKDHLGYTETLLKTIFQRPSASVQFGEPLRLGSFSSVAADAMNPGLKDELARRSDLVMARLREMAVEK